MKSQAYGRLPYVVLALSIVVAFEFACLKIGVPAFGNQWGPILIVVVSIWGAGTIVSKMPELIISCMPWFLIATAIYAGVGPLVLVFGSDATIESYPLRLQVLADELLRTNILNSIFSTVAVASFCFLGRGGLMRNRKEEKAAMRASRRNIGDRWSANRFVLFCVSVGIPLRLFVTIPYEFGLFDFYLPGVIYRLGGLSAIALLPMACLLGAKKSRAWFPTLLLFSFELAVAMLTFSKSSILICIVFPLLGYFLGSRKRWVLVILVLLGTFVFIFAAPYVKMARETAGNRFDSQRISWRPRIEIVSDILSDKDGIRTRRERDGVQYGWRRLNYANAQWFVMEKYHQGVKFDFYKNAMWVVVPRVLVSSKPNMTELGVELNYMINNHRHSSMAVGFAAEAYGTGGGGAVLIIAIVLGGVLAYLDSMFVFLRMGAWLYLPIQLQAMRMAYRLDGAFVPDLLGCLVIIIGYTLIVKGISAELFRPRS